MTNDFVDTFKSILDFLQGSDFNVDDYIEDLVTKQLRKLQTKIVKPQKGAFL